MSTTKQVYAKYVFSDEEKREMAMELALKCQEKQAHEDEKKSVTSSIGAKINMVSSEINLLSSNLRQGYDYRNIECEMKLSPETKTRKYYSVATGELIKEEPFHDEDYQVEMELIEK